MTKKTRNRIFLLIRVSLLFLALANIAIVFSGLLAISKDLSIETLNQHSKNIENAFFALITLALTYGTEIIEKRQQIDIPDILEIIIALFIFAGICLSVQFNLYYRYFWWDDLLHALSGVILGFIGFMVVYKLNYRFSMDINPALIALFSFSFAVTFGVLWEILEFAGDVLMGTAHQKWNLPETALMLGKSYQGSGLRDTMTDLVVDCTGAFITSVISYFMYKNHKKKVLREMEKIVHDPLGVFIKSIT